MITDLPNFRLSEPGLVSGALIERGVPDFHEADEFVWRLPYGRTSDRIDLSSVLSEGRGTCSSKHAFLAQTARDQDEQQIELILGIVLIDSSRLLRGRGQPP